MKPNLPPPSPEYSEGFSDGYEEPLTVRAEAVLAQEDAARDS